MDQQFNILSLSGGGIRGLFTVSVLAEFEKYICDELGISGDEREHYSIANHFDMICGTSIGGLIALALSNGATARHIQKVMKEERLNIFPKNQFDILGSLKKLTKPSYKVKPLKKALENLLGESTIGQLSKYVLIPAISYTNGQVRAFKTPHHPYLRTDYKLSLVDVALATSAAPTYFPIHQIEDERFVDGGLAANSPVLMGIFEAEHYLNIDLQHVHIMQVGTMGSKHTSDHSEKLNGGYFSTWESGKTIIELSLSSTEGLHDFFATKVMGGTERILKVDEEPGQKKGNVLKLDNASDKASEVLMASAKHIAKEMVNDEKFRSFIHHHPIKPNFYYGPNKNSEVTA